MTVEKNDALKYFSELRSHFSAYHNHKEASAWGAAVVYLVLLGQILGAVKDRSYAVKVGAFFLVEILLVAVWVYVSAQFARRRDAANYIGACLALSAECLASQYDLLPSDSFRLVKSKDDDQHSPHVLAAIVLEKAKKLDEVGHGTRIRLERSVKMVLAVTALAAGLVLLLGI